MRTIPPTISDIVNYNTMSQRKLFFGFFFVPAAPPTACAKAGRDEHRALFLQAGYTDVQIFEEVE
jgi:hypothetical protein